LINFNVGDNQGWRLREGQGDRPLKYLGGGNGVAFIPPPNVLKMSLQIVTLKEIEKEKNRRYDTNDRPSSLSYRAIDLYAGTYYDND